MKFGRGKTVRDHHIINIAIALSIGVRHAGQRFQVAEIMLAVVVGEGGVGVVKEKFGGKTKEERDAMRKKEEKERRAKEAEDKEKAKAREEAREEGGGDEEKDATQSRQPV